MKNFVFLLATIVLMSCKKENTNQPTNNNNTDSSQQPVQPLLVDCIPGNTGCSEILISGDPYDVTPTGYPAFSGHADPSIRKDPDSDVLWLSYSHPHYKQSGGKYVPSVAIHLAKSGDKGNTWTYVKTLWEPHAMPNPANNGQQGYLDHETVNLLPVKINGINNWVAARLNYFIPDSGGFAARPANSYHISVLKANTPEELSGASKSIIGGSLTHASWQAHLLVPPDLSSEYFFWNEPSLFYDANSQKLYLIMVAFVYQGTQPIFPKNNVYVYSTNPEGNPEAWVWNYNGKLVDEQIAKELDGQRLTQTDVAYSKDGKILLIATPDDWNDQAQDFNHKGCKIVEIKSLESPELARDVNGKLIQYATITVSDANELGSGASSYEPTSNTGVLITRRIKTNTQLTASIWQTGAKP